MSLSICTNKFHILLSIVSVVNNYCCFCINNVFSCKFEVILVKLVFLPDIFYHSNF